MIEFVFHVLVTNSLELIRSKFRNHQIEHDEGDLISFTHAEAKREKAQKPAEMAANSKHRVIDTAPAPATAPYCGSLGRKLSNLRPFYHNQRHICWPQRTLFDNALFR